MKTMGELTTGLVCPGCLRFKQECICSPELVMKYEMIMKGNDEVRDDKCRECGKKVLTNFKYSPLCNACDTKPKVWSEKK